MPGGYSDRKLFAGLVIALRMAWKLTVSKAMQTASRPASTNIHHWIETL